MNFWQFAGAHPALLVAAIPSLSFTYKRGGDKT